MKRVLTILFLGICALNYAQTKYTYYLTGRPFSVERNNAIRTVGLEWNILFTYAGNDVVETQGLESINKNNDSVSALVGTETKLGEEWLNTFYAQVDEEEKIQNKIRKEIKEQAHYKEMDRKMVETFLFFTKEKKWFHSLYTVYIVGLSRDQIVMTYASHGSFSVKVKKKKQIINLLDSSKGTLPFTLPQNGIF